MFGEVAQVLEATKLGGPTPQSGAEFEVPRAPRQDCWRQVCEELPGGPDWEAAVAPGDGTGEPAAFHASDGVEGAVPGRGNGRWCYLYLLSKRLECGLLTLLASGPGCFV